MSHFLVFMIREILKRSGRRPLFALEKHRDKGTRQHNCRRNLGAIETNRFKNALSDSSVADLVMILNEADEAMLRETPNPAPVHAIAIDRIGSVVDKGTFQSLR